jgi:uncharacterized membrane protein
LGGGGFPFVGEELFLLQASIDTRQIETRNNKLLLIFFIIMVSWFMALALRFICGSRSYKSKKAGGAANRRLGKTPFKT